MVDTKIYRAKEEGGGGNRKNEETKEVMKTKIVNYNSGNKLDEQKSLLEEILNADPYCDFLSSKYRTLKYLKEKYPEDSVAETKSGRFLIETLSCILDHYAFERDQAEFFAQLELETKEVTSK
mgnify:CR=1 FL=1